MSKPKCACEAVVVVKIGGSILTGRSAHRRAAEFIRNRLNRAPEERPVVVVSAKKGVTDSLLRLAEEATSRPDPAALDLLWSTGELRSVALLALHLQALGVPAAALNVHETGLTLSAHGRDAAGVELNRSGVTKALASHLAVVVPGFLAVGPSAKIVSLGRGGSDLTAVLIAQGLQARRCELIKDVPGYFTSDPRADVDARHLPVLTFEQALHMAEEGCDLVQRQALEAAARSRLPLLIRSLDETAPRSWIAAPQADPAESERIQWTGALA